MKNNKCTCEIIIQLIIPIWGPRTRRASVQLYIDGPGCTLWALRGFSEFASVNPCRMWLQCSIYAENLIQINGPCPSFIYLCNSLNNAIIRINSLVRTVKSLKSIVFDYFQSQFESTSLLFQFAQHTIRNVWIHCGGK